MTFAEKFHKFRAFLKEDSWQSLVVNLLLAVIIIKFIIFPTLVFLTGTSLPLVIVESCSMHHPDSIQIEEIVNSSTCLYSSSRDYGRNIYLEEGILANETGSWPLKNGFNKGDIIFVVSAKNAEVGDVIIYTAGGSYSYPIIHRIVDMSSDSSVLSTKGDNPLTNSCRLPVEEKITSQQVVGKAVFRVPLVGWIKLIFFDWKKPANQRGFC